MFWKDALLVAAGGALGAVARFAISQALRTSFPWGTTLVNLAGSFALGFFLLPGDWSHGPRLLLGVGFLGAFTTLSTFSVETVDLLRAGHQARAGAHVALNALGGPLLAWIGWRLA